MRRSKKLQVCTVPECPKLTPNSRCEDHRINRPSGRRWTRLRRAKMRAFPMCELGLEGCELWAVEVDHRIPLMDGGDPWAWDNLQSACHLCHVIKTTEEQRRISWIQGD